MATRNVTLSPSVKAEITGNTIKISGPKGELKRDFRYPWVVMSVSEGEVIISTESTKKLIVAMVGTITAHIANMCKGVENGFEYHMKVVYNHFPIQLKLIGNELEIHNFLGEKKSRFAKIEPGVSAKVGNEEIVLFGINKELVGLSAANIEHATKIRNRDPRVFQDGIYIIKRE